MTEIRETSFAKFTAAVADARAAGHDVRIVQSGVAYVAEVSEERLREEGR